MSEIERYTSEYGSGYDSEGGYGFMQEDAEGDWVSFEDHQRIVAELKQKLAERDSQLEKAEEALRSICDPDNVPNYHHQGMGCGLEDRNITDRYEAMHHGWYSAMDRVYDEVISAADEYFAALNSARGKSDVKG